MRRPDHGDRHAHGRIGHVFGPVVRHVANRYAQFTGVRHVYIVESDAAACNDSAIPETVKSQRGDDDIVIGNNGVGVFDPAREFVFPRRVQNPDVGNVAKNFPLEIGI